MRIVNDNIEILRGETATYDVNVIDNKKGYPYSVSGMSHPYVEFLIKKNVDDKEYMFKRYLDKSSVKNIEAFEESAVIENIEDPQVTNNKIYYVTDLQGYWYKDAQGWHEYNFNITFQFPYDVISKFDSKTYKYQINVLDGTLKTGVLDSSENPYESISFCDPILKPHDFIVGGSL